MADYTSMFRTNYFWVKDEADFLVWVATLPGLEAIRERPSSTDTAFGLFGTEGSPAFDINDREINFATDLAPHLVNDQVAILIEVGHEKLRYLDGSATAIHADGRSVFISTSDIYRIASETFDVSVTRAEY